MTNSGIHTALAAIALAAVALPTFVVTYPPAIPVAAAKRLARTLPPRRVVPQEELPPVEPVKFVELAPDDARAFNAAVPFAAGPNPPARPFRYAGTEQDRARATACLAAAVLYEAGDDATGERAVAQVILNRLRHPAFPKTVCGVVFEGAERTTGCQFTFTCDGAIARWKPAEAAWKRASDVAAMALSGSVYRPVGYATHYHTDWVVPYWQSSLDKIAKVGTHLFFRWSGWWGTPPAFDRRLLAGEPAMSALAALSPEHGAGAALASADATLLGTAPAAGSLPLALPSDPDTFVVALDGAAPPDSWRALATTTCRDKPHCVVMGWTDRAQMPAALPPTPAQTGAMAFSYLRDRLGGFERALWNCAAYPRSLPLECMKRSTLRIDAPLPVAEPMSLPAPLAGVRRRGEPTPAPNGTPTPAPRATPASRVTPPGTSPAAAP